MFSSASRTTATSRPPGRQVMTARLTASVKYQSDRAAIETAAGREASLAGHAEVGFEHLLLGAVPSSAAVPKPVP